MSYTHSFTAVTPPARYDGIPWTLVRVEEAATQTGTFAQIASLPVTPDPTPDTANPINVTVTTATLAAGWFRFRFDTAISNASPYSTAIQSPTSIIQPSIDQFRLELGDTPAAYGIIPISPATTLSPTQEAEFQAAALFNDAEAAYFLAAHPSSVLLAVAAACDALAARFAQDVDVTEDGQSFKESSKSVRYAAMAVRFRARAVADVSGSATNAGLPIGRVPSRVPTTWQERW